MFFNVIVCSKIIKIVFINSKSATLSAPPHYSQLPTYTFLPKLIQKDIMIYSIYMLALHCLCLMN